MSSGAVAAQVVNGLVGYGHFCIEHNRGHHVYVATPEDSVSARMGESICKFVLREIPGAFRRGWGLERERLQKLGRPVWSFSNEILSSWLLTAGYPGSFGLAMITSPLSLPRRHSATLSAAPGGANLAHSPSRGARYE